MTPPTAKRISRAILAALIAMLATQVVLQLAAGDRVASPHLVVVGDPDAPGMAKVRADVEADLSPGQELGGSNVPEALLVGAIALIWGITGTLIVSRQPRNAAGWIFCVLAAAVALNGFAFAYTIYSVKVAARPFPAQDLVAILGEYVNLVVALIPLLVLLFPDGRPPSPRWRWATRSLLAGTATTAIAYFLTPGPLNNLVDTGILYANPVGVAAFAEGGPGNALFVAGVLLILGSSLATVVAAWQRFRRARGEERQQMRWLVAVATVAGVGIALILLAFPILALLGQEESSESDALFLVFFAPSVIAIFLGIPAAYLVAIFKYRLWELDVVIKKAVVAFVLTLLLVGMGVFVIYVPGQVALWGGNEFGVMLGVIAGLLIWPVVRLARRIARRIVFGRRADPYEVLTGFSGRVGETYATEDVLPRMAQMLAQGTGASVARVWLRVGNELRPEAAWPTDAPQAGPMGLSGDLLPDFPDGSAFEVLDGGRLLGALSVTMPASDPMNPAKEKLVRDLASQAGLVLRNVRLIEELRDSRRRLVTAQDEERRKIERNIHDGAQQQLVALAVKQRLTASLVGKDDDRTRQMLEELQAEANEALENLRDLARGIYPPLLADKGLAAALEAQARKSPVPVTVEADALERFSQEVEAAAYFCVLEALQNVAKYAEAARATVRLSNGAGELRFEVSDDGSGFDPAVVPRGSGLQNMADRLAALGGALEVRSAPGAGTRVSGRMHPPSREGTP